MSLQAVSVLAELRSRGIELRADGERLLYRPVGRMPSNVLARLKEERLGILAILKVRQVLAEGRRLPGRQLREATELDSDDLYWALGFLYEEGTLKTDPSGVYWLEEVVH